MSQIKIDVLWSPNHEDKFLTFGTDLNLYKIDKGPLPSSKSQGGLKISDDSHASLLSVNSDHQYMKCFAWYPRKEPDHLLAIGLANGRLVLTSFGKGGSADPYSLIGKEFIPKHARQCNYVAWNPVECNIIAEGLEKYRADYSILIWDVNARSQTDFFWNNDRKSGSNSNDSSYSRPLVELGPSETTLSLAWFSREPKTLVTGMNNKYLRIFDLRDTSRPQSVAYTKAVYGVKVDPHCEYRLASYYESQLSIWDTRNFDKPVLTKSESKPICKMTWSPTRNGLLACLTRDSSIVKLYDIQNTSIGSDELEPSFIERVIQTTSQQQHLSSFDWHPTCENRLLTVSMAGAVKDLTIFERIAHHWSPDIYLTWACGRQLKECNTIKLCKEAGDDITIRMKRRASKGYGLQDSLEKNVALVWEDPHLRDLWYWIQALKEHSPHETSNQSSPLVLGSSQRLSLSSRQMYKQYPGVTAIVGEQSQAGGTMVEYWTWQGLENTDSYKFRPQRKVFKSEERRRALDLCGWGYDKDSPSLPVIEKFESEREFEKAAAIAIFTLKLKKAIQVLNNGAKTQTQTDEGKHTALHMIAMALSGFSEDKKSLWKEMCSTLHSKLQNPYLRAMFAFMTTDGDNYDDILNETGMTVVDRTAFACMYLNDKKLVEYLDSLTGSLMTDGNLNGILLTGLTTDAIDLMQQYVDITGDVQTASLAFIQSFPNPDISKDARVSEWIESYRSILDHWSLWYERAEFDVYRNNCDKALPRSQAQVFVSCTFCGKPISYNSMATRNRHFMFGGAAALKSKISSCPSCRKPLPRCAICLINMGTASGSGKTINLKESAGEDPVKLTQFNDWFTWCQSCRHGGHAEHMTQWYRERPECPVTGCTCKCASLDTSDASAAV